eukprot:4122140-Pyramimonas_sp.AAC.1
MVGGFQGAMRPLKARRNPHRRTAKLSHKDGADSRWIGQRGPDQKTDNNGQQPCETVANGNLHLVN